MLWLLLQLLLLELLLFLFLLIGTASTFIMALQLVQPSKAFTALSTAIATNLLVNIPDMANVICPALERPSADTTDKCWDLQMATRVRGQLSLGWEGLVALWALESPRWRSYTGGHALLSRSRRTRLIWGFAASERTWST